MEICQQKWWHFQITFPQLCHYGTQWWPYLRHAAQAGIRLCSTLSEKTKIAKFSILGNSKASTEGNSGNSKSLTHKTKQIHITYNGFEYKEIINSMELHYHLPQTKILASKCYSWFMQYYQSKKKKWEFKEISDILFFFLKIYSILIYFLNLILFILIAG